MTTETIMKMTCRSVRGFLPVAALLLLTGFQASAVTPQSWKTSSYEDFNGGDAEKVAILNPGQIRLSPSYRLFSKVDESAVWSLIEARNGKTLYAGTGNRARIYKISAETKDTTSSAKLLADLDGNAVQALAEGPDGFLYAGVSPGGNVYKIAPDGAVTLVGESGEKYIWAMEFDQSGNLILATGDKGVLVKMTLAGKVEKLLKTKQKHILSLVRDATGDIYFGTAPDGWVAVLDTKGDFRVLYDSALSEVKALALDDKDNLYAGIIPTLKVSAKPRNAHAAMAAAGAKTKADKNSELVRISPQGLVLPLLKTDNAAINCLYPNNEGLLVGTGNKGLLFRLGYRDNLDRLADLKPTDILVMASRKKGGIWMSTANPAGIYVFPVETKAGGIYATQAFDAGISARWGNMTWKAEVPKGATLDFQTRSGNTEKPDDNWSDWSDPLSQPGPVTSSPARFLQWRARFGGTGNGASAEVREVEVVYQKMNQPPRITALKVGNHSSSSGSSKSHEDSKSGASGKSSSNSAAKSSVHGTPTLPLSWRASDANGDPLVYDLHYRRVGETLWKKIKEDLKSPKFTWDLRSMPDGDYEIQVTASDRSANPARLAREDTWISEPVRVDVTPPKLGDWKNPKTGPSTYEVSIQVSDEVSRIVNVEKVLDGDEEKAEPLLPVDGILDSRTEDLEIRVEDLKSGEHSLTVRAKDEMGNIGAKSTVFKIP